MMSSRLAVSSRSTLGWGPWPPKVGSGTSGVAEPASRRVCDSSVTSPGRSVRLGRVQSGGQALQALAIGRSRQTWTGSATRPGCADAFMRLSLEVMISRQVVRVHAGSPSGFGQREGAEEPCSWRTRPGRFWTTITRVAGFRRTIAKVLPSGEMA